MNAGSTHTSGFDLDLKTHYDAGALGRLTAEATWTHLLTYQLTFAGSTFELAEHTGLREYPVIRAVPRTGPACR